MSDSFPLPGAKTKVSAPVTSSARDPPSMTWASPHMWSVPVPLISVSLPPRALSDMEKASP